MEKQTELKEATGASQSRSSKLLGFLPRWLTDFEERKVDYASWGYGGLVGIGLATLWLSFSRPIFLLCGLFSFLLAKYFHSKVDKVKKK